jgi:hypothetical protein
VAHSRSGRNTGFQLALKVEVVETNSPGVTDPSPLDLQRLQRIVARVSMRFPFLRTRIRRDGIQGQDSRDRLFTPHCSRVVAVKNKKEPSSIWGDDLYLQVSNAHSNTKNEVHDLCYADVRHVTIDSHQDLSSVLEKEAATEWHDEDPESNLWRVTLVTITAASQDDSNKNAFYIVLTFHHSICDGGGSLEVAKAILTEANNSATADSNTGFGEQDPVVELSDTLPPPMEDVVNPVPSVSHLLLPILLDRFPSLTRYLKKPHWQGSTMHVADRRASERSSCMTVLKLLKSIDTCLESSRFHRVCRQTGVSPTSLLVSTLAKTIASHLLSNEGGYERLPGPQNIMNAHGNAPKDEGSIRFKIQVAASERRRRTTDAAVSSKHLGVYVSAAPLYLVVDSPSTTTVSHTQALAKEFGKKLVTSLETSVMDLGLLPFVQEDWIDFSKKGFSAKPNGIHESLEVSNLGIVQSFEPFQAKCHSDKEKRKGSWQLQDVYFSLGRHGFAAAITVTLIGTPQTGMNAVLSSFPEAVSKKTLITIGESWKMELGNYIHSYDLSGPPKQKIAIF